MNPSHAGLHPFRIVPSILSLPSDLLVLILSYVRLHPLLHAASLVSKQWRAAAMRSVTSLKVSHADPTAVLRLFPCLTAVDLGLRPLGLQQQKVQYTLPLSVRRLSIRMSDCVELTPSRPFTHLSLGDAGLHCLPLLQDSLGTLEHLVIGFKIAEVISALSSMRFPALTSLKFFSWAAGTTRAFLAAHASQLTAISCLTSVESTRNLQGLHFPCLRTLQLKFVTEDFVISAPSLTHLRLSDESLNTSGTNLCTAVSDLTCHNRLGDSVTPKASKDSPV